MAKRRVFKHFCRYDDEKAEKIRRFFIFTGGNFTHHPPELPFMAIKKIQDHIERKYEVTIETIYRESDNAGSQYKSTLVLSIAASYSRERQVKISSQIFSRNYRRRNDRNGVKSSIISS